MIPPVLGHKALAFLLAAQSRGLTVAMAESCTGGLLSAALTSVAGSSSVVERGFVTYSNQAKIDLLGVSEDLIRSHGAVSAEVASAMVAGVLDHSPADLAASITGIAGPDGAVPGKPVGTVFIGVQRRSLPVKIMRHAFPGGRDDVRMAAVNAALDMLIEAVG